MGGGQIKEAQFRPNATTSAEVVVESECESKFNSELELDRTMAGFRPNL